MFLEAKEFFEQFTSSFDCMSKERQVNSYYFKYHHTYDVVEYMKKIIETQNLSQEEKELALTCAIFHDLGRFTQLKKCGKYDDVQTTFDHAKESIDILRKYEWFQNVSKQEEEKITYAILEHNKIDELKGTAYPFLLAKMLRDADKLAILSNQVLLEEISEDFSEEESEKVFECLKKEQLVHYKDIKSNLDWIIAYFCYLFDMNLEISLKILKDESLLIPYLKILKTNLQKEKYKIVENIYLKRTKI